MSETDTSVTAEAEVDDEIGIARQHMVQAANRSSEGQVLSTMEHLDKAVGHLKAAGLEAKADVVDEIRQGDVCCWEARYELRQLAQFLFVDEERGFEPASEVGR